jgi:2-amino-4-hydroxy-6-hydroxymethyldihydropteridine diphosphokinase
MNTVYLSLGSNRGDRLGMLREAIRLLGASAGRVTLASPVFETPPWGFEDPTPFYNCAVEMVTDLEPREVLTEVLATEEKLGRVRGEERVAGSGERVYHPRTIDIDILFYNHLVLHSEDLIIPHPEIANRRFVLEPLNRICPGYVHPVLQQTVSDLLAHCQDISEATVTPFSL